MPDDFVKAQTWAREPLNYVRECIEASWDHFYFFEGTLVSRTIDPMRFLELHMGESTYFEFMVHSKDTVYHYMSGHPKPVAVYPIWDAQVDPVSNFEDLIQNPISEADNPELGESEYEPVPGQKHVVVVANIPNLKTKLGKRCLQMVRDVQNEYPEVTLHISDLFTFAPLIAMGFKSFDFNPRKEAQSGSVFLPNGRRVKCRTEIHRHGKWVSLMGFRPVELDHARNRCIFSLKALNWAVNEGPRGEAFAQLRSKNDPRPDHEVPDDEFTPISRGGMLPFGTRPQAGDMIDCDTCSLQDVCKLYRKGSVCGLNSEMGELAKLFDTTDSTTILSGLAKLTALSADRAERALEDEKDFGLDPEAGKALRQTFDFAERYAKLNDPALRMNVNLNRDVGKGTPPFGAVEGQAEPIRLPSPNEAAQMAIAYYAELGFKPDDITQDMMRDYLRQLMNPQKAIEAPIPVKVEQVEDAEVVNS